MDIYDVRRFRLKTWLEGSKLPSKEKSYFHQLLNGTSSFGERAARRIEAEYDLGNGYLDAMECVSTMDESDQEKMIRAQLIGAITMRLHAMPLEKIRAIATLITE
jgi:hypothetical protein